MYALACNLIVIHSVVIVLINSVSVFTGHICDDSGSLYMYGVSSTNSGIYTLGERAPIKLRLRRADLKLSTESACKMLSGRWFHLITPSMKKEYLN